MSPADIAPYISMLVIGGAVYGGIRSDMKNLIRDLIRNEKSIESAHHRIDEHIERHHTVK